MGLMGCACAEAEAFSEEQDLHAPTQPPMHGKEYFGT